MVVAAVGLIPAIAGCEAGNNAPTQQWHQPTPGASAIVDNTLRINNMFVLGPAPGFTLPRGASAGVFFALANDGAPDRLLSIRAPGEAPSVVVPAGGLTLGRQQTLHFSGPSPRVVLQHLTRTLNGGQWRRRNLQCQDARRVAIEVPAPPPPDSPRTVPPRPPCLPPRAR